MPEPSTTTVAAGAAPATYGLWTLGYGLRTFWLLSRAAGQNQRRGAENAEERRDGDGAGNVIF